MYECTHTDMNICSRKLIISAWIICFQVYTYRPFFYINAGMCELGFLLGGSEVKCSMGWKKCHEAYVAVFIMSHFWLHGSLVIRYY
jgi:hypothetical protein